MLLCFAKVLLRCLKQLFFSLRLRRLVTFRKPQIVRHCLKHGSPVRTCNLSGGIMALTQSQFRSLCLCLYLCLFLLLCLSPLLSSVLFISLPPLSFFPFFRFIASFCLSLSLSVCLSDCISFCMSVSQSAFLSICLLISLSVYLSSNQCFYVFHFVCLSVYLSRCVSIFFGSIV